MSLKAFHIVFVTASTLLCFGVGGWAFNEYFRNGASVNHLIFGIASFVVGAGLIWYGKYFLKKLKNISYL